MKHPTRLMGNRAIWRAGRPFVVLTNGLNLARQTTGIKTQARTVRSGRSNAAARRRSARNQRKRPGAKGALAAIKHEKTLPVAILARLVPSQASADAEHGRQTLHPEQYEAGPSPVGSTSLARATPRQSDCRALTKSGFAVRANKLRAH